MLSSWDYKSLKNSKEISGIEIAAVATSRKNALEGEPVSSLHATTATVQVPEVSTDYGGAEHLPAPPARTFNSLISGREKRE